MLRQWPPIRDGYSENFASLNRNKRSVALDLKNPEHKAAARRLVLDGRRRAREQPAGRDGSARPRLRVVQEARSRGWSIARSPPSARAGPRSGEGGFDVTVQAMSGIMSVTGEAGGAPVKCGVPVSDIGDRPLRRVRDRRRCCAAWRRAARARISTSRCWAAASAWRRCRPANISAPAAIRRSWARRIRATRPTRRSAPPTATSSSPPATTSCGRA